MQLLPCPVCGKIPKIKQNKDDWMGYKTDKVVIQCKSLIRNHLSVSAIGSTLYATRTIMEAVELWNERVKEAQNGKSCKV